MLLLKGMTQMGKFKLGEEVIEKIMFLLVSTLKQNKEMDNYKQLYLVYDTMNLSLFDLLEDLKKDKKLNKFDSDY